MITSGHIIGTIIDEFSALGAQAKIRNRVGLSDISVFCENFFRDLLNIIEGYNLVNTNEKRANEPGVDLGDELKKIAFQVTTMKTSQKILHTLSKITAEQCEKYDRFVVLVIGEKQQSYEPVYKALKSRTKNNINIEINFSPDNDIIDLTDIARKVVGLDFDTLRKLYNLVQDQMTKVKIELQIPDKDGNYETSGYTLWETLPTPTLGSGKKFAQWDAQHGRTKPSKDDILAVKTTIKELSDRLHKLPRVTREFFAALFERSEHANIRSQEYRSLLLPAVEKTYPDAMSELYLLIAQNLTHIDYDPAPHDEYNHYPAEIILSMGLGHEAFQEGFYDYILEKNLSIRKVIGELDFSAF